MDSSNAAAAAVPAVRVTAVNVSFSLGTKIDLRKAYWHVKNVELKAGEREMVIGNKKWQTRTTLFASGKATIWGASSEVAAEKTAKKVAKDFARLGYEVKLQDYRVSNVSGAVDLGFHVNARGLAASKPGYCTHDPERFPGTCMQLDNPKCVLRVFNSGNIIIMGAKSAAELQDALNSQMELLAAFRVELAAPPPMAASNGVNKRKRQLPPAASNGADKRKKQSPLEQQQQLASAALPPPLPQESQPIAQEQQWSQPIAQDQQWSQPMQQEQQWSQPFVQEQQWSQPQQQACLPLLPMMLAYWQQPMEHSMQKQQPQQYMQQPMQQQYMQQPMQQQPQQSPPLALPDTPDLDPFWWGPGSPTAAELPSPYDYSS